MAAKVFIFCKRIVYASAAGLFLLFWAAGCSKPKVVERAFYYWQTTYAPSQEERSLLQAVKATKLYIRFFDVDLHVAGGQPMPVAPIRFEQQPSKGLTLVPVVFITNRTLKGLSEAGTATLASQLSQKVQAMAQEAGISYTELQLDCDWSQTTAAVYFDLLRRLQASSPQLTLTATIRLHQVKYFETTGVPPVARGMLMFYNMGKLKDAETKNSILDLATARQYMVNYDRYPLPLDLALPVFSWGVVQRNGKVVRLIHDLRHADLQNDPRFEAVANNSYHQIESGFLHGDYGYRHDVIRIEQASAELSRQAAALAAGVIKNKQLTVSLYHMHDQIPEHYDQETLESIYSTVH